ncbi:MAG: sugar phosphate isomerase/epimerase family protein [Candidatus Micrarchaeota archaeon]
MLYGYIDFSKNFETIEMYAKTGVDYVEIPMDYPRPYKFDAEKLQKILDEYSLKVAFHGPWKGIFLGHAEKHVAEAAVKTFENCIEKIKQFDYLYLTVHPSIPREYADYGDFFPESVENLKNSLKKIKRENHVVENLPEKHYFSLPDKMRQLNCNYCLDVGHAARSSQDKELKQWFDTIGKKITAVHLHDTKFPRRDHLFFGMGELNLELILKQINKSSAKYVMLETYRTNELDQADDKQRVVQTKKQVKFCKSVI